MSSPTQNQPIIGTFSDPHRADLAAETARKAGFEVDRQSGGVVVVDPGEHTQHADEIRGILAAYGAREFGGAAGTAAAELEHTGAREQRVRAEQGATVELVEEQLQARTRPVQTGEVTIRKEVLSETRTFEVPVRREELIIERHPVEHQPLESATAGPSDPLVQQLLERLRRMQPGESLRIPIVEEEVVVQKRPVVVEEITLGKRTVQDTQEVSDTVRREEAHVEHHGNVRVHGEQA
jgi:stress response protein YsnF